MIAVTLKAVPGDGEILQPFSAGNISAIQRSHDRQAEHANQAEMAERVRIDRSFLADVERARAAPSEDKSRAFASGNRFQSKS